MNMRRMALKRGLSLILGVGAADAMGMPVAASQAGPPLAASGDTTSEREQWIKPLRKKRDKIRRDNQRRYEAWFSQHPDLAVLRSTSQAWRMSVMKDRLRKQYTVMEALDDKMSAIWEEPLDKLRQVVASWIRSDD